MGRVCVSQSPSLLLDSNMLFAVVAFGLALPAIQPQHRRQLSTTNILTYSPGSQVTDHANIDLDQQAIESVCLIPPDDVVRRTQRRLVERNTSVNGESATTNKTL